MTKTTATRAKSEVLQYGVGRLARRSRTKCEGGFWSDLPANRLSLVQSDTFTHLYPALPNGLCESLFLHTSLP